MLQKTIGNIALNGKDLAEFLHKKLLKRIPPQVVQIAEVLGYELYAVGGCVRDLLLQRKSEDLDLAVVGDAETLAEAIAAKLNTAEPIIYARFGTALLQTQSGKIEFATARKESYEPESRKPDLVQRCSIEEDLRRRDFTVNALALCIAGNRKGELLDQFHGLGDLQNKILRTPLEPDTTFSDDPLRMLRAVRFAAALDFEIDPSAKQSISRNIKRMKIIARERIGDEFLRMLGGPNPARAMGLMVETGLMAQIIPEVTAMAGVEQVGRHAHKDVLIHSLKVMQNAAENSDDPIVRLSGLLHDIGKPRTKRFDPEVGWTFHGHEAVGARMTHNIGKRLCLGKESLQRLVNLVRLHMRPVNLTDEGVTDSAIRRLMLDAGEALDDQLILCRADITTANPKLVSRYLANFEEMEKRMTDVSARDRMRGFQSPVRGDEIMEICQIPAGPLVGALKGRIEDAILDGIIAYDYDEAKNHLLKIKDDVLNTDPKHLAAEIRLRSKARRSVSGDIQLPGENSN